MKYSIAWLKSEIEKETHFEYLFFWGHTPKKEGVVDKSCFSQWYPSAFTVDGIIYATAEHWMMAQKARLFQDEEVFQKIIAAEKPAVAKSLGREVKNFDAAVWDESSFSIVVEGNKHKFLQNEEIKTFLLYTSNKVIVEASPADAIWGIGLPQDATDAMNPFRWRGTNLLGFALMEVRDSLKNE
jgi:ribA/ribD-fused uncharacterized protein